MDDSVAYSLVVFSPILLLQLWLSIRYDIAYISLRGKHSKTYLKKNKGTFWDRLFFKKYRGELGKRLYFCHACLLWMTAISMLLAILYGLLWFVGHSIQHEWVPRLYARLDIMITCFFMLKLIYDKVIRK